ncbi:MAG: type II secretion system F family protein [Eubacteriales bacterium]|nr:type II secretion system F family protein [Eubacteriales bacterium]
MNHMLTNQELFHFCEQFSIILRSGISGAEGLHILYDDSKSQRSREIFESLIKSQEETGSLSQALTDAGIFPDSMISYVKAGEETGCLDEVMASLADHYEQEMEISQSIRSAVTYPLIMLGMMGAVIIILLVKVLPVFQQVFRQMGLEMTGLSSGLLKTGSAISRYSAVFFTVLAVLILCIIFLCCTEKGREMLGRFAARIPQIRDIPVAMDYGRLTQAMSMGLRSGLGPETSLELADHLISHPLIKSRLVKAQKLLNEGALFADAMTESGLFQGMDARLISISVRAGAADEVMGKLSDRYRQESISIVERTISVVEPTIVILLSVLVGLVLLSVMMPLLGILSDMIV